MMALKSLRESVTRPLRLSVKLRLLRKPSVPLLRSRERQRLLPLRRPLVRSVRLSAPLLLPLKHSQRLKLSQPRPRKLRAHLK